MENYIQVALILKWLNTQNKLDELWCISLLEMTKGYAMYEIVGCKAEAQKEFTISITNRGIECQEV